MLRKTNVFSGGGIQQELSGTTVTPCPLNNSPKRFKKGQKSLT